MATYRFILTPLDTVFFGDEKSPFKKEYIQHSRYLPQQTGVLGFVRYEALRRAGLLGHKHNEWSELIGDRSFNGSNQTFGVIRKIGAVGIIQKNTGEVLYPFRNPDGLSINNVVANVDFADGNASLHSLTLFENVSQFNRYDPKDYRHFATGFSDYSGLTKYAECPNDETFENEHGFKRPKGKDKAEGIFWKDTRPGITKNYGGVPNDEGFYKTEFMRMMPGFAFSFNADIDDCVSLVEKDWLQAAIVRFGGDRSVFRVEVEKAEAENSGTGNVFVLKSDTVATNSIYEHCSSVVSEVRHFRNIRTESKAGENFYNKRPGYKYGGSNGRVLLASGSILIAKDDNSAATLDEALQADKAFSNIGYNQFKRLSSLPKNK